MTYNIHPIIVHFPIALLVLYSIIKILPLSKLIPRVAWKDIERILLVLGIVGAFAAMFTGGIAEELVQPNKELVEMHGMFAFISIVLYGVLLLVEIIGIFKTKFLTISNGVLSKILALCGLLAISITGMLGGIMVYGLSSDPLAPLLLNLLNIHL